MKTQEIRTERSNLFEPNVYITMCVEITKTTSVQALFTAVNEAYKANEATMSKIVLDNAIASYKRLSVSGCKVEITEKHWLDIVKLNEKIPFALEHGELIRTFIIPTDQTIQLLVMAHHLVGDGKSILYFIKDSMTSLSGGTLTYKPLTLLTKQTLSKTNLSLPARVYVNYCKYKWKQVPFTWQDYYDVHKNYWQNVTSNIRYKTLSVVETKRIIEEAKHIGCSVNSYIITKLLKRYQNKCEVGIPVSIRDNENEAMTNLTSAISIHYQYNIKRSFAKNAMQVHHMIKKQIHKNSWFVLKFLNELPPTLIDAVLLHTHNQDGNHLVEYTAKIMGYTGDRVRDMGVTNLMVLDIPNIYGQHIIENIVFVPPAVSYCNTIIGVLTTNGKMTITYHEMIKQSLLDDC